MPTRLIIWATCLIFAGAGWYQNDLAAMYVAVGVGAILHLLHSIDVKLNRLLDHHGIFVSDRDIARDRN
jgi:hypothetical protein